MKQLHPSNCIGIRQFADIQGCTDLYKVANNYVMVIFSFLLHFILQCGRVEKVPKESVVSFFSSPDQKRNFNLLL
jgi:hypothetical protein